MIGAIAFLTVASQDGALTVIVWLGSRRQEHQKRHIMIWDCCNDDGWVRISDVEGGDDGKAVFYRHTHKLWIGGFRTRQKDLHRDERRRCSSSINAMISHRSNMYTSGFYITSVSCLRHFSIIHSFSYIGCIFLHLPFLYMYCFIWCLFDSLIFSSFIYFTCNFFTLFIIYTIDLIFMWFFKRFIFFIWFFSYDSSPPHDLIPY